MENKLSITEIRYIRSLAASKTDEQLAEMLDKPMELISAQFALMANLPKRPGEKPVVVHSPKVPKAPKPPKPAKNTVAKVKAPKSVRVSRADRKLKRDREKAVKEQQNREKRSLLQDELQRLKNRKDRLEKSIYATRPLDLTGTVAIKLNAKTTVYVKPGTNIEELKKKYKIP